MKITIDTSEIMKKAVKGAGVGAGVGAVMKGAMLGKKIREKADRRAIESKAKSPFAPLVRQQKVEAGIRKLKGTLSSRDKLRGSGTISDYEMKKLKK